MVECQHSIGPQVDAVGPVLSKPSVLWGPPPPPPIIAFSDQLMAAAFDATIMPSDMVGIWGSFAYMTINVLEIQLV